MRVISAELAAALAADHAVIVYLLRIDFPSGTQALNSSNRDIEHGGVTYRGAYGLGAIGSMKEAPGQLPGLEMELHNVATEYLALALDDSDQVQGSLVTVSTAVLDNTTYQVLDVFVDWIGYADRMPITENGETGTVGLTAESKAVDLLRGNPLVYNDADQQSIYSTDVAFEYVTAQSQEPVIWPMREWFLQ